MTEPSRTVSIDGRRQRSERTRQFIIEAYLALLSESPKVPTAARIAERAGYSVRSLFERFPDLMALSLAAADFGFEQANAQAVIRNVGADRSTRIRTQVETRARTCERWLPLWRALHVNQHYSPELKQRIRIMREAVVRRLELMYRPELSAIAECDRRRILIALEALTDFESWAHMRGRHELAFEDACAIWIRAIEGLLPATPAVS